MLRKISKKFGATAPRVAVRPHIPWQLRVVAIALLAVVAVVAGWWVYDAGRRFAGFDMAQSRDELQRLAEVGRRLTKENEDLRARTAAAESQLRIDHASQEDLAKQVKTLGEENARLREDLAVFQNLVSSSGKEGALKVYRFKVERDKAPGEYRYGLLLVQSGQRAREFHGRLQLVVSLQHNGMRQELTLPEKNDKSPQGQGLSFRHYQRLEGKFRVAPDAVVESLQVRVFADGASEASVSETAQLS